MSKVLWLKPWHELGGWWWEIEGNSGRLTEYRTDKDFEGLHVKIENGPSVHWSQVAGHAQVDWPSVRADMVAALAKDGHDVSAVSVPFAFGETDHGRGDV